MPTGNNKTQFSPVKCHWVYQPTSFYGGPMPRNSQPTQMNFIAFYFVHLFVWVLFYFVLAFFFCLIDLLPASFLFSFCFVKFLMIPFFFFNEKEHKGELVWRCGTNTMNWRKGKYDQNTLYGKNKNSLKRNVTGR